MEPDRHPVDKLFDALLQVLEDDAHGPIWPADVMEALCAVTATAIVAVAASSERTEADLAKQFSEQLLAKLDSKPAPPRGTKAL